MVKWLVHHLVFLSMNGMVGVIVSLNAILSSWSLRVIRIQISSLTFPRLNLTHIKNLMSWNLLGSSKFLISVSKFACATLSLRCLHKVVSVVKLKLFNVWEKLVVVFLRLRTTNFVVEFDYSICRINILPLFESLLEHTDLAIKIFMPKHNWPILSNVHWLYRILQRNLIFGRSGQILVLLWRILTLLRLQKVQIEVQVVRYTQRSHFVSYFLPGGNLFGCLSKTLLIMLPFTQLIRPLRRILLPMTHGLSHTGAVISIHF